MVAFNLAGAVALALAASSPVAQARSSRSKTPRPPPSSTPPPAFDKEKEVVKISVVNNVTCSATSEVSTWASAAGAYVNLVFEAIEESCKGDIQKMTKKANDAASAFAKVTVDTFTKCEVEGSGGYGCAAAKGSGKAQAKAVYDAWVEAYASAQKASECPCVLDAFAETYATLEYWGDVFAKVEAAVDNSVCQKGEGTAALDASLSCYGAAFASITAEATAGAWLRADCKDDLKCKPTYDTCDETGFIKAQALAGVVLEVTEKSFSDCKPTLVATVAEEGSRIDAEFIAEIDVDDPDNFEGDVECAAKAKASGKSSAAYAFVDTVVSAYKAKCKSAVEEYSEEDEGVGRAFAQAWLDVEAECVVDDGGSDAGVGCAAADSFAAAFAEGVADAWVLVDATAMFEDCKCKAAAEAVLEIQNAFTAKFFSDVITTAGVDLWGEEGENCVTDGSVKRQVKVDCLASAMAVFWNKASVSARLEGQCLVGDQSVCVESKDDKAAEACYEENDLRASVTGNAVVTSDITLEPGYCTGSNEGGYYHFDAEGKYSCIKGC